MIADNFKVRANKSKLLKEKHKKKKKIRIIHPPPKYSRN